VLENVWDEQEELFVFARPMKMTRIGMGMRARAIRTSRPHMSLLRGKMSRTDVKPVRTGGVPRGRTTL
jgi:hypothetical protein